MKANYLLHSRRCLAYTPAQIEDLYEVRLHLSIMQFAPSIYMSDLTKTDTLSLDTIHDSRIQYRITILVTWCLGWSSIERE